MWTDERGWEFFPQRKTSGGGVSRVYSRSERVCVVVKEQGLASQCTESQTRKTSMWWMPSTTPKQCLVGDGKGWGPRELQPPRFDDIPRKQNWNVISVKELNAGTQVLITGSTCRRTQIKTLAKLVYFASPGRRTLLFIHACTHSFFADEKFKTQSGEGSFLNSQDVNDIATLGE